VGCQVEVIEMAIGVLGWSLAHHNATVQSVELLQTCVNTVYGYNAAMSSVYL
jgi:hypothetical protein